MVSTNVDKVKGLPQLKDMYVGFTWFETLHFTLVAGVYKMLHESIFHMQNLHYPMVYINIHGMSTNLLNEIHVAFLYIKWKSIDTIVNISTYTIPIHQTKVSPTKLLVWWYRQHSLKVPDNK